MKTLKDQLYSIMTTLDVLMRGPPIPDQTIDFVRGSLYGGVLGDFIANPGKYKDEDLSSGQWTLLFYLLRQLTPEILSPEELNGIDLAISNGSLGEELREAELNERNRQ
jgi:hypothetical protein